MKLVSKIRIFCRCPPDCKGSWTWCWYASRHSEQQPLNYCSMHSWGERTNQPVWSLWWRASDTVLVEQCSEPLDQTFGRSGICNEGITNGPMILVNLDDQTPITDAILCYVFILAWQWQKWKQSNKAYIFMYAMRKTSSCSIDVSFCWITIS